MIQQIHRVERIFNLIDKLNRALIVEIQAEHLAANYDCATDQEWDDDDFKFVRALEKVHSKVLDLKSELSEFDPSNL